MQKMYTTTFLSIAVVLGLTVPAGAQGCVPAPQDPEVDTATIPGGSPDGKRYYVDNDPCQLDSCVGGFSIWVYQESNGIGGLQRNDGFSGDQACGYADTILF